MPVTKSDKEAKAAVECCRPRLYRELKQLHPNAGILVMGRWALYAVTGKLKGGGALAGFHVQIDLKHVKQLCDTQVPKKVEEEGDIPF